MTVRSGKRVQMELIDLLGPVAKDAPWVKDLLREVNPPFQGNVIPVRRKFPNKKNATGKSKRKTFRLIRPGLQPNPNFMVGVTEAGPGGWITTRSGHRIQLGSFSHSKSVSRAKLPKHKIPKAKSHKDKIFKEKNPKKNKNPKHKYKLAKHTVRTGKKDVLGSKVLATHSARLKKNQEQQFRFGDNIKKASEEISLQFLTENDYAKIQSQNIIEANSKGQEIYYCDATYVPEDDRNNIEALILLEDGSGLVWITKDGRRIPIGGSTTAQRYRNPKTQAWRADRALNHQKVVDNLLAGKMAPEGRAPIAYILGGGTASGKTTASRQLIQDDPNIVRIDPDELKLSIAEYEHLKITDPENAAMLVHDESSRITKMALAQASARGLDLTYDSTTSGEKGVAFVRELASKGYDVRAIFVDIPVAEAMARADLRARQSLDPINRGRMVPEGILRGSHQGAANSFFELKNDPALTSIQLYDNTGKSPRLIYQRIGGGQEQVHDQARFRKYSRKSVGLAEASKKVCSFERPGCLPDPSGHRRIQSGVRQRESQVGEGKTVPELILEVQSILESVRAGLTNTSRLLQEVTGEN